MLHLNANSNEIVERLAASMRLDGSDFLARKHSVLQHLTMDRELEGVNPKYYLAWPIMMGISVRVAAQTLIYQARNRGKVPGIRLILGPEMVTWFFEKVHPLARNVRNLVMSSFALDIIYNVNILIPKPRSLGEWLLCFWLNQPDGSGVRNRLRITHRTIYGELVRKAPRHVINVLSLASGSAQGVIEAIARFRVEYPDVQIKLTMVDMNQNSLGMARRLANDRGVGVVAIEMRIQEFLEQNGNDEYDIVEMVGFGDYREAKSFTAICKEIRRVLVKGGLFVSANIAPNHWDFCVRWLINWPKLIRRTREEFSAIVEAAFNTSEREFLMYEPTHTHSVGAWRKTV